MFFCLLMFKKNKVMYNINVSIIHHRKDPCRHLVPDLLNRAN